VPSERITGMGEALPTKDITPSDRLAIALTCLAGIMAIILFFVEKTRWSIFMLLTLMVLLAIYPVLHFIKRRGLQATTLILVLVGTLLFGYNLWPKTVTAIAASPAPFSQTSGSTAAHSPPSKPAIPDTPKTRPPTPPSTRACSH
jgi:hypothetical protein